MEDAQSKFKQTFRSTAPMENHPCHGNSRPPPGKLAQPGHTKLSSTAHVKQGTPAHVRQATPAPVRQAAPAPVRQATPAPVKQPLPAVGHQPFTSVLEEIRRATELINKCRNGISSLEETIDKRSQQEHYYTPAPEHPQLTGSQTDEGQFAGMVQSVDEILSPTPSTVDTSDRLPEMVAWKHSLDLEYLQPKFNFILPEVFNALRLVDDANIRSQFEFLLNDFRGMFLERKEAESDSISLFLDDIRVWLRDPKAGMTQLFGDDKFKQISSTTALRVQEAKELQKQVFVINDYFSSQMSQARGSNRALLDQNNKIPSCLPVKYVLRRQHKGNMLREATQSCGGEGDVASHCVVDSTSTCVCNPSLGNPCMNNSCINNPVMVNPVMNKPCINNPVMNNPSINNPCTEISQLLEHMQALSKSLRDRERRITSLRKSTALLSYEIEDVENTLEACDEYLEKMRSDRYPVVGDLLRREMCAFQESILASIFSCIDILYEQLKPLHKGEEERSARSMTAYKKYTRLKKEEEKLDTNLALVSNHGNQTVQDFVHNADLPVVCFNEDLFKTIKTVVAGIDVFQEACVDLWSDTLRRITAEVESLLVRCRPWVEPPITGWTNPAEVSLTSKSALETDLQNLKLQSIKNPDLQDELFVSSLKLLERMASEISRVMVTTRLRDLQLISLDHKIGLVYLSLNRKAALLTKKHKRLLRQRENKIKLKKLVTEHLQGGVAHKRVDSAQKTCLSASCIPPSKNGKNVRLRSSAGRPVSGNDSDNPEVTSESKATQVQSMPGGRCLVGKKKVLRRNGSKEKTKTKQNLAETTTPGEVETEGMETELVNMIEGTRSLTPHMVSAADMNMPLTTLSDTSGIRPRADAGTKVKNDISPWSARLDGKPEVAEDRGDGGKVTSTKLGQRRRSPSMKRIVPQRKLLPRSQRIEYRKEVYELRDDNGKSLDIMGNVINVFNHKTIYYGSVLPIPTPPPRDKNNCS
ncbi:uncharacterized protein LOC131943526 [Physella acuta]|uniref:uncharacterized protein LOC131943526 n=1 Tax=Physella acuta TaxID=109671 RepID=UPI0027DCDE7B|nr:uncharacterized protein LOC131943526 [Physella acuta]